MANPIIRSLNSYNNYDSDIKEVMTPSGVMTNFFILGILMLLPALVCWNWVALQYFDKVYMAAVTGSVGGLIVAIITSFNPKLSPYLAPVYAVLEGLVLGGFSAIIESQFPGVVVQAVASTMITVFAMAALYKSRLIQVNYKFRMVLLISTFSIFCLYLISLISSLLFHNSVIANILWSSTPLAIGVSVIFCLVAAFNLLIDFDNIERFSMMNAPKYMEWYCAFGLLVTIVWLYMELLRLLAILGGRRR